MNVRLIAGALAIAASLVGIAICYLGARNPREPKWAGEMIMGSFLIPLSLGGIILGLMLLLEAIVKNAGMLGLSDIIAVLVILAAGIAVIFMLRIKKRIAAYDALRNTPEFMAMLNKRRAAEEPATPSKPLDHAA
jgi:hypothetical protein